MTKPPIDQAVDRFLCWKLPEDFHPDAGISFTPHPLPHAFPIGTNLFTAIQAKAMLEHVAAPLFEKERQIRDSERKRILAALIEFLEGGGGSFRRWLDHLGMDYHAAYDEGWMAFTNALSDHESRILGKEPEPLI